MTDSSQCYYYYGQDLIAANPQWVPCYEGNSTNPHVPCCVIGSYCLNDNMCEYGNGNDLDSWSDSSPFYVAACTDPSFSDAGACRTDCEQASDNAVVYQANLGQWQCCANATEDLIDCENPPNQEYFRADAPTELTALTSLAKNYEPYITAAIYSAENSQLSQWLTNEAAFSSAYVASSYTSVPSYIEALPSALRDNVLYGATDYYTAPGPLPTLSAIPTSATAPATTSAPNPTPLPVQEKDNPDSDSSKASTIGPAVGVPVGVIAIIAIIFGVWFYRRKKRRARQAQASMQAPPPNMGQYNTEQQQHQSWYGSGGAGGYYAPVPQEDKDRVQAQHTGPLSGTHSPNAVSPPQEVHGDSYVGANQYSQVHEMDAGASGGSGGRRTLHP